MMILRWGIGVWGLVSSSGYLQGGEPDFERLFPISTYEQCQQALIKAWEVQDDPAQQLHQLTNLLGLIQILQQEHSQSTANNMLQQAAVSRADLAYQVRLLDYITGELAQTRNFKHQLVELEQIRQMWLLIRVTLNKLS